MGSSSSSQRHRQSKPSAKATIFDIMDENDWSHAKKLPWHNIDELDFNDKRFEGIPPEFIKLILSRCGNNLKKLVIIMDSFDLEIVQILKKYCRNLKILRLIIRSIDNDNFINAFCGMKKLKEISMYAHDESDESNTVTIDLSKILRSIRDKGDKNELCSRSSFIDEDLAAQKIIHNFEWVLEWSEEKLNQFNCLVLKKFNLETYYVEEISKQKRLKCLSLFDCTIKEGTLFTLNLPNLIKLELQKMANIDNCLVNIAKKSKNLKTLNLEDCQNVSVATLQKLSNLKNLKSLNFTGVMNVDDSVIIGIANECKKLESLNLHGCIKISTDGFKSLANLKNLKKINMGKTYLNGTAIIAIGNNCKKLTLLSIDSCKNVPETTLEELSKLVNLDILRVSSVVNITDFVLLTFSKLKVLDCDNCSQVTDIGIQHIIEFSPHLNCLRVCNTGITYNSLVCAGKAVKNRKNNIALHFYADNEEAEYFIDNFSQEFASPLLKVYGKFTSFTTYCCDNQ